MDIKDYVKQIEATEDKKLLLELNTLAMRSRITRLDKLYGETAMELAKMAGKVDSRIAKFLEETFKDGYYHGLYDIAQGWKIKLPVAKVDSDKLRAVLKEPWSGKNYSQRLWKNTDELAKTIRTEILGGIHRGASAQEMARNVSERMDVGRKESMRLVRTEMNYAQNRAAMESIKDAGMSYFVFIATLDRRTSATCRNHDGHVYKISEAEQGTNVPPLHPYCRSTIAASLHGSDGKQAGTRIGRDGEGKTIHVPAEMKYKDWEKIYIDESMTMDSWLKEHPQKILKSGGQRGTIEAGKRMLDIANFPDVFRTKTEQKNTQKMVDYLNGQDGANPDTMELYGSMREIDTVSPNGIEFTVKHSGGDAVQTWRNSYSGELTRVKLVIPKLTGEDLAGQIGTTLHEEMHLMDLFLRENPAKAGRWFSECQKEYMDAFLGTPADISASMRKLFDDFAGQMDDVAGGLRKEARDKLEALRQDLMPDGPYGDYEGYKQYQKAVKKVKRETEKELDYQYRNIMGGGIGNLQDIYDALSAGRARDSGAVRYGHGSRYYTDVGNRLEETLANYGSLSVLRPDLVALLKKDKPDLVKALKQVVKNMLQKAREKNGS